jgi:hypothetical protein
MQLYAILNLHARLAHLETNAPFFAALGTADIDLVHLKGCHNDEPAAVERRRGWCYVVHTKNIKGRKLKEMKVFYE